MPVRKVNSSNFLNETFLDNRCVLNKVIKMIGKRWTVEILLLIENDICRFSTLKEMLSGVSDTVLSNSLQELVKAGQLTKNIYQQIPLKVEYSLTQNGKELLLHLHQLCGWGKKYMEV